jgi:hypothetical protein
MKIIPDVREDFKLCGGRFLGYEHLDSEVDCIFREVTGANLIQINSSRTNQDRKSQAKKVLHISCYIRTRPKLRSKAIGLKNKSCQILLSRNLTCSFILSSKYCALSLLG